MYDDTPVRIFDFHDSMLADDVRTLTFLDAILDTVKAGDVVLDLGCGTGILSLCACLAGADKVYAVEGGSVITVARDIVARSRFAGRIEFFEGWSTEMDLPAPVDVVISETIGNMAFEEGIVGSVIDARSRFLGVGGRVIPKSLGLVTALVESPEDHFEVDGWARPFYTFDLSPLRSLAINSPLPTTVRERSLLTEARPIIDVDLTRVQEEGLIGRVEFEAHRSGVAHGLGCWFSCELRPGHPLSNGPPNPVPSWDQVLLPFDLLIVLESGDTIEVEIGSPDNGRSWHWAVDAGTQKARSRYDSCRPASILLRSPPTPTRTRLASLGGGQVDRSDMRGGRRGGRGRGGGGMGAGRRRTVRRTARRRRRRRRRRVLLVGGLIGLGAYKLGKRDVERIEQHTGTSAEELTDEELDRAMEELDIEKEYREAEDQEATGGSQSSDLDELKELGKLRDAGVLTDEEFEAKKRQILDL